MNNLIASSKRLPFFNKNLSRLAGILLAVFLLASTTAAFAYYKQNQAVKTPETNISFCGTSTTQSEGKALFRMHCASCHHLNQELVVPKLTGTFDRIPTATWFDLYITDEPALIAAKDEYALKLDAESNVEYDHAFTFEDSTTLKKIADYIKTGK